MRKIYLILIILLSGFVTLFFFPEPATNFLAYFGTMLFFMISLGLVLWIKKE